MQTVFWFYFSSRLQLISGWSPSMLPSIYWILLDGTKQLCDSYVWESRLLHWPHNTEKQHSGLTKSMTFCICRLICQMASKVPEEHVAEPLSCFLPDCFSEKVGARCPQVCGVFKSKTVEPAQFMTPPICGISWSIHTWKMSPKRWKTISSVPKGPMSNNP